MSKYMAMLYADVIRKSSSTGKTINDVPEVLKESVSSILKNRDDNTLLIPQNSVSNLDTDALVMEIRQRVASGENLRTIIADMDLTDEEKWELEKRVKEG